MNNLVKRFGVGQRRVEETAEENNEKMSREYHDIVEVIKSENKVMGPLQLHQEAMARLNEQRGASNSNACLDGDDADQSSLNNNQQRPRKMSLAHQLIRINQQLAKNLRLEAGYHRDGSGMSGGDRSDGGDPANNIMPGRRESSASTEFDPAVIEQMSRFRDDLELSDSDEDEASLGSFSSPSGEYQKRERDSSSGNGGSRSSLIRRGSSILRRGSSRVGSGDTSSGRRRSSISNRRSSSILSRGDNTGSGANRRRSSASIRRSGSIKLPGIVRNSSVRRSSADSSLSHDTASSSDCPQIKVDGHGNSTPKTADLLITELTEGIIGRNTDNTSNGNDSFSDKLEASPPIIVHKRGSHPRARTGKRRSSLYSVDEQRALMNDDTAKRSSMVSPDNSVFEKSLNGSFSNVHGKNKRSSTTSSRDGSYVIRDGSLICSFGQKGSFNDSFASIGDDSLICMWERQTGPMDSTNSIHSEDLEGVHADNVKASSLSSSGGNNNSLICGWDAHQSMISQLSIPEEDCNNTWERQQTGPMDSTNSIHAEDLEGVHVVDNKKASFLSSSGGNNNSLICGWDAHQSMMSQLSIPEEDRNKTWERQQTGPMDSTNSIHAEDLEGVNVDNKKASSLSSSCGNNNSLICGWDAHQSMMSQLSIPEEDCNVMAVEDEEILMQAKREVSLFDVKKSEVV